MSLLTDYKHGFDATPNQLRLTLLKAPLWPDPGSDRGLQSFCYGIYPHAQGWQQAHTVQAARNFNLPIQACPVSPAAGSPSSSESEPAAASFLDLGETTLVMSAFKQAEDGENQYILRGYESTGASASLTVGGTLPVTITGLTDMLEQPQPEARLDSGAVVLRPWQIVSLAISTDTR